MNHDSLQLKIPIGQVITKVTQYVGHVPGFISCAGVTGSVCTTCHAHAIQMAGLMSLKKMLALHSPPNFQSDYHKMVI